MCDNTGAEAHYHAVNTKRDPWPAQSATPIKQNAVGVVHEIHERNIPAIDQWRAT